MSLTHWIASRAGPLSRRCSDLRNRRYPAWPPPRSLPCRDTRALGGSRYSWVRNSRGTNGRDKRHIWLINVARYVTGCLHSFFTKLFHKRVNISARARDKIPRLTRTPSGTQTPFTSRGQIVVRSIDTRDSPNKRARESQEIFLQKFEERSARGALRSAANLPNPPVNARR
jgi:hypothetical protein